MTKHEFRPPSSGNATSQATIKITVTSLVGYKPNMPAGKYAVLFEVNHWYLQIITHTDNEDEVEEIIPVTASVEGIVRGVTLAIGRNVEHLVIFTTTPGDIRAAIKHKNFPTLVYEPKFANGAQGFPVEFR